jgi:O-antigen ligase
MRSAVRPAPIGADEALLIGLTGLVIVAGLTIGGDSGLAYLVVALPVVLGLSWWRPVYGFAMLLGLVLLTEEFEIRTLAGGIEPWLLQSLPIFRNLQDYTPLGGVYANAVEAWIGLLVGVWAVKGLLAGRLRVAPIPCTAAWLAALVTIGTAFVLGVTSGGDVKPALWEVRALGYLLGLAWLVPQIVERRQDVVLLVAVMTLSFGAKALQGLYRYVVELGLQLDLRETFMAHEDPVMFVPLFFLFLGLHHYKAEPLLRRLLLGATPLMFLALVFTQRRVAYLGLGLSALVFLVELTRPARRTFVRLGLPLALVFAAYVAAFAGSSSPLGRPIDRFMTLFDSHNPSNHYRVLELENLRYTIQLYPWGIGFGHPYEMFQPLPDIEWGLQEYIPHNEVLWVWVKTGTLGFILVMYFFCRLVAEGAWTYRHVSDPLLRTLAAIVPLAIINQLVASYYELQLTYSRNMIFLGTLIGLLGPIRAWGLPVVDHVARQRRRWRLVRGVG